MSRNGPSIRYTHTRAIAKLTAIDKELDQLEHNLVVTVNRLNSGAQIGNPRTYVQQLLDTVKLLRQVISQEEE